MSQSDVNRPVNKQDLFAMRFLQGASLSPNGQFLVYAVSQYSAEGDQDITQLWLRDMGNGQARQITHGQNNNSSPAFAPDSKQIAFLSDRDEAKQIHLLSLNGGEAMALTSLSQGVMGAPVWSPDGQKIAFTTIPEQADEADPSRPYRVSRHIYRFDAIGYLDDLAQDLFVLDLSSGVVQQLTADKCLNSNPQWSPDGTEILFGATMAPDSHTGHYSRLKVSDLQGNCRSLLSSEWGQATGPAAWHPSGQHIIFAGIPQGLPIGSKSDLYLVSAAGGGTVENRTATLKFGVGGRVVGDEPAGILATIPIIAPTRDGNAAFIRVQQGGEVQIYRIALTGPEEWAAVISGQRTTSLIGLSQDEQSILFVATNLNQPADLYAADVEGGNERQLTDLNQPLLTGLAKARIKHMLFSGSDGVEVEGWTLLPATGNGPFPAVLHIHGGPHSAYGHSYHFDAQMLVGAGYAVILVNHRASSGYGDAFSTAIKGDWGNLDYLDLMAGVDYAVDQGWADPDRLGVCGLSGGGNLSCWIVGQTDRFKAAVPENPVTNWVSFYGVSDIGPWFAVEQLGGRPYEIPEIYAKCSPITYAHNCTTPTLLVQGEHDYRCPAEQSEQFYTVLKAHDCPVEMLRLPASSHGGTKNGRPALRRAHNDALLDWMNRYVLGIEADGAVI